MFLGSNLTRIAFALAMWSATVLLAIKFLGLFEDDGADIVRMRESLCEIVAVTCSQHATSKDADRQTDGIKLALHTLVHRHPDIRSAGCRKSGELFVKVGNHEELWKPDETVGSTSNCIYVPILDKEETWGTIEVCFRPIVERGLWGVLQIPSVKVTLAATFLNLIGFFFWLRRCVQPLDPSSMVPQRVRTTLDTMAEAVVVLDRKQRIVTCNAVFSRLLGETQDDLNGREIGALPWTGNPFSLEIFDEDNDGVPMQLSVEDHVHSVIARSSDIVDDRGFSHGWLLSFADVTALENARSRIEEKNKELEFLATRDPLTSCLNRRSFFEIFENRWNHATQFRQPIGCVMVDIDHFKSINDTYGHAMGDEVLKTVSGTLNSAVRNGDYVCRYGGEEFCILLVDSKLNEIALAAERYRRHIEDLQIEDLKVTASLGCSELSLGATSMEELLEQADQSLYHSKKNGRNRVTRYDELAESECMAT